MVFLLCHCRLGGEFVIFQHSIELRQLLHENCVCVASLIAQLVKNPSAMQEAPVQFLGREDLLEKG